MMETLRTVFVYILSFLISIAAGLVLPRILSPYLAAILVTAIIVIVIITLILESKSRRKLRHFEKLTKKSFPIDNDISLYKGFAPTFADIGSNRDVIRELHHQLFPHIMETKNSSKNSYLSIIAPPQEGKSTLLLRFAKELVDNKEIVLWADATYKFAQENPFDELKLMRRWRKKRIFAIIDNIARLSRYGDLLQDLARHPEIKVTLIGASRIQDWEEVKFQHPPDIEYLFKNPNLRPRLPYRLEITESDIKAAVKKLQEKGVLKEPKRPISKPESFYILIWALAAPEGEENFSSVMLEEADRLSEPEKRTYCYICALHRFGLPMPAPLNRTILGKEVLIYLRSLEERGVIRYISKIDCYISRHEVVAETIFRDFCPQIPDFIPLELYKNILHKATLKEEILMVLLFEIYLEKELTTNLKNELAEKYDKTFSKSESAKLLGLGWGSIFTKLSFYDLAEKVYKKSIDIDDTIPEVHYNYANFLVERQRYPEAGDHFKMALELKEDYPETHINYALLLIKFKKYQKAEGHYNRALELKEDFPEAHNHYANFLIIMRRNDDAELNYKRALELKEDFPDAHNNYATLLVKLKRYQKAEFHYKRALNLKENYPEAHLNYGVLLVKLKRYREAEGKYNSALELKKDFPEAYFNYAILLSNLKRYEEAEDKYKRALELREDFAAAINNLGFLYLNKDFWHPQKAINWLKKAWEQRDSLPDKGEKVSKALKALSSEKGKKKEEKPPSNEL